MIMRGSTALESANALFRRAQAPANAERLCPNIWDGVTATRSTRRWLHRGRAFAVASNSFALDIPHVASLAGIAAEMLLVRYGGSKHILYDIQQGHLDVCPYDRTRGQATG